MTEIEAETCQKWAGPLFDRWFERYAPTAPELLVECAKAAWMAALVAGEAIEYQIGDCVDVLLPSGLESFEWRSGVIVGSSMIFDVLRYEIHGNEKGSEFVTMATWRVMRPNVELSGGASQPSAQTQGSA